MAQKVCAHTSEDLAKIELLFRKEVQNLMTEFWTSIILSMCWNYFIRGGLFVAIKLVPLKDGVLHWFVFQNFLI